MRGCSQRRLLEWYIAEILLVVWPSQLPHDVVPEKSREYASTLAFRQRVSSVKGTDKVPPWENASTNNGSQHVAEGHPEEQLSACVPFVSTGNGVQHVLGV